MTTPADFYGVPLEGVVEQVDTITLTGTPSALTKTGIVSYPSLETAQATPTADVIAVYDVTASIALVLNTDYTLTASGSAPESQTYSVTRISSSPNSTSGDTCKVTYRWGTVPDTSYSFGDFQGEPGVAPAGTQFAAGNQDTSPKPVMARPQAITARITARPWRRIRPTQPVVSAPRRAPTPGAA